MKSLEVPEYSCPSAGQCGHGAAGSHHSPRFPRCSSLTDQQCSKGLPGAVWAPASPRLKGVAQQPYHGDPRTLQGMRGDQSAAGLCWDQVLLTGSPHLPVGSQLHEGADGLIGAGPAGQHVAAVVGLEEADEVGTLGLLEGGWLLVVGTPAVLRLSSQCPEATCRASRPRSPPRPCLPAGSAPPVPWVPARRSATTQPWAVMGMRCRMPGAHPLPRADLLGLPARLLQVQQDDVVLGSHHQPGPVLIQQQRLGARHIPWGQQPLGAVGLQQL